MESATAEILSCGDELVLGEIADTNAAHIAAALWRLGVEVRSTRAVGDRMEDITAALRESMARSRLVVLTGGLGPTGDDLTREAAAQVLGVGLEYHDEVVQAISRRFNRPLDQIRSNNRRQAFIPAGSRMLENPVGTAPGFMASSGGSTLFALPGVPHEMRRMFADYVEPHVRAHVARDAVAVRRLHTTGVGESEIDARLGELMDRGRNPSVGTKVEHGVCTVRILARAATEAEASRLLAGCERTARARLGDCVFGADADSLEQMVVSTFTARGLTLALAESCTGGLVGGRITAVSGSSRCFLESSVAYANGSKTRMLGVSERLLGEHGAVSAEVAEAMASGARDASGASIAVSVTGIAGPEGGTEEKPVGTVWFGLAAPRGVRSVNRRFFPPRDAIRERAVSTALALALEEALAVGGGAEGRTP